MKLRFALGLLCIAGLFSACSKGEVMDTVRTDGMWFGVFTVAGNNIPIEIELKGSEGVLTVPAQRLYDAPISGFQVTKALMETSVSFTYKVAGQDNSFAGTLEGEVMKGELKGGGTAPASFRKAGTGAADALASLAVEKDIECVIPQSGKDPITLYATLTTPATGSARALAIIVPGSGPTDRDGNSAMLVGRNDSLLMVSRTLAGSGYATLRYDKRGIARSWQAMTSEADIRFEDMMNDLYALVSLMRSDYGYEKIILIGHSEGSLVCLATQERLESEAIGAEAVVSIAGVGRRADDILREQLGSLTGDLKTANEHILTELAAGRLVSDVPKDLATLYRPSVQPYLISWFAYDPAAIASRLVRPLLIVQGGQDTQVRYTDSEALLAAQPAAAKLYIDGMNHLLKTVTPETNALSYSDWTLPLAPELMPGIISFLDSVLK